MRVAVITTLNHNVGDDFVREGILYLLEQVAGDLHVQLIHKHIPVTARPALDWYYHKGWSRRLDRLPKPLGLWGSKVLDRLPLNNRTDKILNCDLLVQSGAPVYWLHPHNSCADAEWLEPLIERRWKPLAARIPLFNLAAGSCQLYHSDASEFASSPRTLDHIRRFFDCCRLTTLRDELSLKILQMVGRTAPVLPCTSIYARQRLGIDTVEPSFVALNYMPAGGHYDFGQNINPRRWRQLFGEFATDLARRERCVLICHNETEWRAAQQWFPGLELFYSPDHKEILRFYAGARYGIVNRVHASFAIASFGRPSIVIGTDSRARMAEQIGLKHFFVSTVTRELLEKEQEQLARLGSSYRDSFAPLARQAEARYLSLLKQALNRGPGPA